MNKAILVKGIINSLNTVSREVSRTALESDRQRYWGMYLAYLDVLKQITHDFVEEIVVDEKSGNPVHVFSAK